MRSTRTILLILLVSLAIPAAADDWPRFRGVNGSGSSSSTGPGPSTTCSTATVRTVPPPQIMNQQWTKYGPGGRSSIRKCPVELECARPSQYR